MVYLRHRLRWLMDSHIGRLGDLRNRKWRTGQSGMVMENPVVSGGLAVFIAPNFGSTKSRWKNCG